MCEIILDDLIYDAEHPDEEGLGGTKNRAWVFTWNNYAEEDFTYVQSLPVVYAIFGREFSKVKRTPHIQGYLYFKDAKSFERIKKYLPKCYLYPAKGNPQQNQKYCSKTGNFIEIGECPQQGKRTDVELVRTIIKQGGGMRGVVREASNLQQIKIAEMVLKYEEPCRNTKPLVLWYWGLTATGKSETAHKDFEGQDFYRKTATSGKWWEGYDAHENVIIDDLDIKTFDYKVLLDLTDRYGTRIECKGATRQFLAKKIIITSSWSPREIFGGEDQQGGELLRRIDKIVEFRKK